MRALPVDGDNDEMILPICEHCQHDAHKGLCLVRVEPPEIGQARCACTKTTTDACAECGHNRSSHDPTGRTGPVNRCRVDVIYHVPPCPCQGFKEDE